MQRLQSQDGPAIIAALVETAKQNRSYLSELDGAIGDGDHGVNMSKGFALAAEQLGDGGYTLSVGLETLGMVLMMDIGGAMGPLYGTLFVEMAGVCQGHDQIDASLFGEMLKAARAALTDLGGAKRGDKTLMDALIPAVEAYATALKRGEAFGRALAAMSQAAEAGKESTRNMVAKIGRASRLGERSRGHLDAGATSCWLIMRSLARSIEARLVS